MIKNFLSISLFLIFSYSLMAQHQIKYTPDAKVPMDSNIRYGKLANGLTYYVLANKTPKNRAEFYLVNNVGAMQENASQNGLAHLTEHMCFNGTKNFHKKDIIHYLESIGMKFGPEINAYTVYDQTVYTLDKVPLETPENIDTALLILYDWATNVSMETDEINAERGVVREELRTRRSAMSRMRDKTNKVLFEGSKYAVHNIIGEVNIIDNAPCDTLRAFYNDWYRPDLQAIIVVGDFNPEMMVKKIKTIFSKLPIKKNERERKYYQIPDHDSIKVALAQDVESPYSIVQAVYKKSVPKRKDQAYYREQYLADLYASMINARFSEEAQKVDPPFMQAFSYYGNLVRTKDAYMTFAVASNTKIKKALEAILAENERVKNQGFLPSELARAKKELLAQNKKAYMERNKKKSAAIANSIKANFLDNEPIPGDKWDYDFAKKVINGATLAEVNALGKKWITDKNLVITVMAPKKEGVDMPTKAEVLSIAEGIHSKKIAPYVDAAGNKPLLAKVPVPGTIVKQEYDKKHNVTRWTLSNGVKVVMKPTKFKDDEILMSAISDGGWSQVGQKDDISAKVAADVAKLSGIGSFSNVDLQKKLAGKVVSISPYIHELSEGFTGHSSVADFNTLLKLNYLYFTHPRFDKDAFASYKQRTAGILVNKSLDPQSAFVDTIRNVLSQNSPRRRNMTVKLLDEAKLNRIKYIFSERFGDPSGFTYYFVGNINPQLEKDTILKYLGGLPTVHRQETWNDLGIRMPEKRVEKHFKRKMETNKATVFVGYTGVLKKYSIKNALLLEAVKEYLNNRYLETLREDQGGTYGAGLWSRISHYPVPEYQLGVYFDANPAKLDTMLAIVYDEADKLVANGPDSKVIKNIAENKIKEYNEHLNENNWWLSTLKSDDFNKEDLLDFDYIGFWKKLTAKKVQKAAKEFLNDDRTVEIVQKAE